MVRRPIVIPTSTDDYESDDRLREKGVACVDEPIEVAAAPESTMLDPDFEDARDAPHGVHGHLVGGA
jgi:hypothetical protein